MTIKDQSKDENLQYYINREPAKISALSSSMNILLVKRYCHLINSK